MRVNDVFKSVKKKESTNKPVSVQTEHFEAKESTNIEENDDTIPPIYGVEPNAKWVRRLKRNNPHAYENLINWD
jgi:hypothetical protein